MSATAYHRAGHDSRVMAFGELVLAIVYWFILDIFILRAFYGLGSVHKLKELTPVLGQYGVLALNAAWIPATWLAMLTTSRSRPRQLWSVAGKLRLRWLATCAMVALVVELVPTALDAFEGIGDHGFVGWSTFVPQLAMLLLLVPLQATGEETFFRGELVQSLGSLVRSPWPAAIVSTVAFALLHGLQPEILVSIGAFGACCVWLTLRTGGLEAAMGLHVVNNVAGLGVLAASGRLRMHVNDDVSWLGAGIGIAVAATYTAAITRLARRRLARPVPPASA